MATALITETSVRDRPFLWFQEVLLVAFAARGDGFQQMVASVLLGVTAYALAFVGAFVTLLAAFVFTVTFFIGLTRVLWAFWRSR